MQRAVFAARAGVQGARPAGLLPRRGVAFAWRVCAASPARRRRWSGEPAAAVAA